MATPNRPLSPVLVRWCKNTLRNMAEHVESMLVPQIECEPLYEQLINDANLLHVLRTAAKHLPMRHHGSEDATVMLRGRQIRVELNFEPNDAMQQYLVPDKVFTITPVSKLGQALLEQQEVTDQWAKLRYVFDKLTTNVPASATGFAMPWLAELAADLDKQLGARPSVSEANCVKNAMHDLMMAWKDVFDNSGMSMFKNTVVRAEDDLAVLISRKIPRRTIRMGDHVRIACRAGTTLISQYRMLMASGAHDDVLSVSNPPIKVISRPTDADLPKEFTEQVNEAIRAWFDINPFNED